MRAMPGVDIAFIHGHVHTVDPTQPRAEAVAIAGEKILAVGATDEIMALTDPSTEVVDLAGRMLLPGFQDSHCHPPSGGLDRGRCNLEDIVDRDEVFRTIRTYADTHPDVDWILGGNWSMETFPGGYPTAAELDAVVSDRPVFLPNRDGHDGWANTKAMEIAGVSASTSDPDDGRIRRDATGAPTGVFHEGAQTLILRHAPLPSAAEVEAGILVAQAHLHSLGITAWQDAIVGDDASWGPSLEPYAKLAADGRLTARVVGALWWQREQGVEQVEVLKERRALAAGRFRPTSVKLMQDGIIENGTAAMLEPYLDGDGSATDNSGLSFIDPEALQQAAVQLDAEGFQMHFHAIGDRGVREALDAIEAAARANGSVDPRDLRHHISHIQVIDPVDLPRFAALGVTANGQPLWACHEAQMDLLTIPAIGAARAALQYPFRRLLDSGARLAFGSDWAVSSPDPLLEMEVAVTRTDPDGKYATLMPEERISTDEAIHAFTMGSAYVNHLDDVSGSITPGKFADLCVVDQDLLQIDDGRLSQARVQMTVVGGETVFLDEG